MGGGEGSEFELHNGMLTVCRVFGYMRALAKAVGFDGLGDRAKGTPWRCVNGRTSAVRYSLRSKASSLSSAAFVSNK